MLFNSDNFDGYCKKSEQLKITNTLKYFVFFLFGILLSSCDASFGEKYIIGNLEIYFTEDVGRDYVKATGAYFDQHGLIQNQKHSIQLTSDEKSFIMKMVLNDEYKTLPETQQHNLELLEEDIRNTVFDSLNFRIEVCNANFSPIETAPKTH